MNISDPKSAPAYGSVLLGADNVCRHHHCILVGSGLRSDRAYQFKIGNADMSTVLVRDMTAEEYRTIYGALVNAVLPDDFGSAQLP